MVKKILPAALRNKESFSRQDYVNAMESAYHMTLPQISYDLQKRLDNGELVRMSRGEYTGAAVKPAYQYTYAETAERIAAQLSEEYFDLDFRIMELWQMNEFVNHQIAHNTIFVYVENEFVESVFEGLFRTYPGRVMLKPGVDEYYRYLQDNQIVVCRLPSESPKGTRQIWHMRLEQIVVEVIADKLVSRIIPAEERPRIIQGSFERYQLDEKAMRRYARRKGVENKVRIVIDQYRNGEMV